MKQSDYSTMQPIFNFSITLRQQHNEITAKRKALIQAWHGIFLLPLTP